MKLRHLVQKIGAKVYCGADNNVEVERIYASDRVSDLLSEASDKTLLVTNLTGSQLLRAASLMDVPAICLLNGVSPETEMVKVASEKGIVLVVSPLGMFETCGQLYLCMAEEKKGL
ncbi:MAG: hypothetical protein N2234_00510 [Planctomycetota bacterium]|nr:hypothetical protein [Planctomycetota bacterium]